jgi:phage FluMu protein Com
MAYKIKETLATPDYIRKYGREPSTVRCSFCNLKLMEFEEGLRGTIRLKCRRCNRSLELSFYDKPKFMERSKPVEDIESSTST